MDKKEEKLTNFLPINRKLFEHKFWTDKREFSKFEAWLDLLQSARFEISEGSVLIGYKTVKYGRGQFVASYRFLATRWQWSTKKVGNYLGMLEENGMLKKETVKETPVTLITICKYETYNTVSVKGKQPEKREGNARETGGKREGNESNKVNKENKEIIEITIPENVEFSGDSDPVLIPEEVPSNPKPPRAPKKSTAKPETQLLRNMNEHWLKKVHPGWTYTAVHGQKMKSLITKTKSLLKTLEREPTDELVLRTFQSMCLQLPEYYKDKDLKILDSDFNQIITEIAKSKNGQPTKSTKQSAYDSAASVWRT